VVGRPEFSWFLSRRKLKSNKSTKKNSENVCMAAGPYCTATGKWFRKQLHTSSSPNILASFFRRVHNKVA
jgi:hypothetical protein